MFFDGLLHAGTPISNLSFPVVHIAVEESQYIGSAQVEGRVWSPSGMLNIEFELADNGSLELTMSVVHSGSLVCCFACCCSLLHIVVRCCMLSKKVQGLTVGTVELHRRLLVNFVCTACFPRFTVGEFGACQMCARERSTFMFCVANQWL